MGDTNNQHNEFVVTEFMQDAITANADPPKPSEFALQRRSEMRCLGQPVDRGNDSLPIQPGDALELLGRAFLNPN